MRRLMFLLFTLSQFIGGANIALAQTAGQNELGLYYDENDLTSNSHSVTNSISEFLHLILLNPYYNLNEDNELFVGTEPVDNIKHIVFRLIMPEGQFAIYELPTPGAVSTYLDNHMITFLTPILAVNSQVYLGSLRICNIDLHATSKYYLVPSTVTGAIPGRMTGLSYHRDTFPEEIVIFPVSGSYNDPVFVFNGNAPVATEHESWSSVKALYR